jgi:L-2-amino-thiazoline-4-carboxylic acid hydrolase
MALPTNENISLLDEVKMVARVLVPVIKAFRAELGAERANEVVRRALRDWSRRVYQEIGAETPGSPRERWAAMTAASMPRIGDAIDIQMLKQEPDAVEFNITGCRYADFFRQLGEPELGALLLCDADFDVAEVGSPEVTLTRTQTIMKGASSCDFRYRMKKPPDPPSSSG